MVSHILPENRKRVDYYLSHVWRFVAEITTALEYANDVPEHLGEKFTKYVTSEEARIRSNLDKVKFDIDAVDTVQLVVGGKIEKVSISCIKGRFNC